MKTKKKVTKKTTAKPAPKRGQFAGTSLEQLRELFAEEIGRTTQSSDRAYLEWKIRQARLGKVRVGPRRPREGMPEPKLVPFRLELEEFDSMDLAWQAFGMRTRMHFLRAAIVAQLQAMNRMTKGSAKDKDAKEAILRALNAFGVDTQ